MYYSKSTGGFYSAEIHGGRKITVIAPSWVHPEIEAPDPEWIEADHPEGTPVPTVTILDPNAIPDTIEIDNPDCKIPLDAVEITADEHSALLAGQSVGSIITTDATGRPMLADPPPPTPEQAKAIRSAEIKIALALIDAKSTRPLREGDTARIAALEAQAALLRSELAAL